MVARRLMVARWLMAAALGMLPMAAAADDARAGEALRLLQAGRLAEAATLLRAEAIERRRLDPKPTPMLMALLSALAHANLSLGRADDAAAAAAELLEHRTGSGGANHPDSARAMSQLAAARQAQGRHLETADLRERALGLLRQALTPRHPELLAAINNLAFAYTRIGRGADALPLFEEVLEGARAVHGEGHANTRLALHHLAGTLVALGEHERALPLLRRRLEHEDATLGPLHAGAVAALRDLAQVLRVLGRPAEAEPLLAQLVQRRREVFGDDHRDTWLARAGLAEALREQGRPADALPLAQQAAEGLARAQGPQHRDARVAVSNLAVILRDLGRWDEARGLLEGLAANQAQGIADADRLTQENNLAGVLLSMGLSSEALALIDRALEAGTRALGGDHPAVLTTVANRAAALRAMGRPADALPLIEQVVARRTARLGEHHRETLLALSSLAAVQFEIGRAAEAAGLALRVLDLGRGAWGATHPYTLATEEVVVQAWRLLGRLDDAMSLQLEAMQRASRTLGPRHPTTLRAVAQMASLLGLAGRAAESRALLEATLGLAREVFGARHPETWATATQLVLARLGEKGYAAAVALNEQTLAEMRSALGEHHPMTITTTGLLAGGYLMAGRVSDAAALSDRYVQAAERLRSQPGLSSLNRRALFASHAEAYRLFSWVHGSLGQAEQGLRLAELGKARTLLEALALRGALSGAALPPAQRAALQALEDEAAAIDRQLERTADVDARRQLDARHNDLARRHDELRAVLRREHPSFAQLDQPPLAGAAGVARLLPPATVALSFVVAQGGFTGVWLVDGGGPRFRVLASMPHLAEAVETFRLATSEAGTLEQVLARRDQRAWKLSDGSIRLLPRTAAMPAGAVAVRGTQEVADWLSRQLLQPLAPDLAGASRWVIAPDGALAQLPFDALTLDGRRVAERHQLQLVPSLTAYARGRERGREYARLPRQRELLAVGNPEYQPTAAQARGALRAWPALRHEVQLADTRHLWQPLPGTEAEVRALHALFPRAEVLLGAQATEARLQALDRNGELAQYRRLHFATHAFFSADNPALSSVVLGQVNPAPGTDGFITAAKWAAYRLQSDLTVLSGCETGLGSQLPGEGLMGLTYALFLAGNQDAVVSLWPVDDDGTAAFMQAFYARLAAGAAAAQALAQAKREFAAHPRWAHPRYWAGFILVGPG